MKQCRFTKSFTVKT